MESEEDPPVYCQPCDEEGPRLPASGYCMNCKEHLCRNCFIAHKKHKLSKHHALLDSTMMPKSVQQSSTSMTKSQPDDMTTPCPKHPKEIVKFYCNYHKELLCNVCVTLEHQSTRCKVNYIPDISGDIIDSTEYQETLKAVNTKYEQYEMISEDFKKMTEKANSSLKAILVDIKTFRQEMNTKLDELEAQAEDAAKRMEQDNNKHLKTIETTCEETNKHLKILLIKIQQLNTSKQADNLFMELKKAEHIIQDVTKGILQLSSHKVEEHIFIRNEAMLKMLQSEMSIGKFTQKTLSKGATSQPSVGIKSRKAIHQGEICVKKNEQYTCWVTGMTLLTPDLLIISEHNNKVIKTVDISSGSVTGQLKLADRPWDITTVTNTELAVTLPEKETIQFMSMSSNTPFMKRTIKVCGKCHGISYHQDKFAVSFCYPAKLQIIDIDGTVLKKIDAESNFKYPRFIAANDSAIFVSDWGMGTVRRLSWQGEMSGCYGLLDKPGGISLSDDGNIFVCDFKRSVVEEISGNCRKGRVVMKNINQPHSVCWCADRQKMYLSCMTKKETFDNVLHIYMLS